MLRRASLLLIGFLSACGPSQPSSPLLPGCEGQPRSRCVTSVSVGDRFGCALLGDGSAWCWGRNDESQLGYESSDLCPERLSNGQTRSVACHKAPQQVGGVRDAIAVSAGASHVCVLTASKGVRCWGSNTFGQLGNGATLPSVAAVAVSGIEDASAVASGARHACAVVRGAVFCWGLNDQLQLGVGDTGARCASGEELISCARTPVRVPGLTDVVALSAGDGHTCARTMGGEVRCWGSNVYGQLGRGVTETMAVARPEPVLLGTRPLTRVLSLVAGGQHTCVHREDGAVLCWGWGQNGQLGVSVPTGPQAPCMGRCIESPVAVEGFEGSGSSDPDVVEPDATSTDAGRDDADARASDGATGDASRPPMTDASADGARPPADGSSAGDASMDASAADSGAPVLPTMPVAASVAAGAAFTCIHTTDGTVRCFGANRSGELGSGRVDEGGPTLSNVIASPGSASTNPLQNVRSIEAGSSTTCVILGDRSVRCWGSNETGALGNGTLSEHFGPVAVTW
ncbi:MAG: hypothetical protein JNK05_21295 [Myxococcales bacterium]|nr:hypothetical protein [Myxococcales bacterium]